MSPRVAVDVDNLRHTSEMGNTLLSGKWQPDIRRIYLVLGFGSFEAKFHLRQKTRYHGPELAGNLIGDGRMDGFRYGREIAHLRIAGLTNFGRSRDFKNIQKRGGAIQGAHARLRLLEFGGANE